LDRDLTAKAADATPKPDMDVAAYFARIGYSGPADATLETLSELVAAHGGNIPFENLDPCSACRCPTSAPMRWPTSWYAGAAAATATSTTT
jgi:hypothetical protein